MSMTDPIADMLTRIRNAVMVKHERVNIPYSKFKEQITKVLKEEGYIENFKIITLGKTEKVIKIYLRYAENFENAIYGLKRVSKPGCRVHVSSEEIPYVMNGLGTSILSTNKGVLSGKSCRKQKLGGEVLCQVW